MKNGLDENQEFLEILNELRGEDFTPSSRAIVAAFHTAKYENINGNLSKLPTKHLNIVVGLCAQRETSLRNPSFSENLCATVQKEVMEELQARRK